MYSMKDRERLSSNGHSGSAPTRPKNRVVGISGVCMFFDIFEENSEKFRKMVGCFSGLRLTTKFFGS